MIMYFSATGNTKYCAEFIASRTNEGSVVSLNEMMKNGIHEIDCNGQKRLGIFTPVYDWNMAYSVSEFLTGLEFRNVPDDCYIYGVFTCGSASGISDETLKGILSEKGLKLSASFVVAMPDNFVLMLPQKSDDAKRAIFTNADKTLHEITKDIEEGNQVFRSMGRKLPGFMMFMIRKFFIPSQKKVKGFSVNDNCTGCGLCEKLCPMNIIVIENNRPVWKKDNCACCLACLHRCPQKAINRGRSAKNGRYTNPNVKM